MSSLQKRWRTRYLPTGARLLAFSQVDAMAVAAQELVAAARSGEPHQVDVAFGAHR
jgi:hypothetical protein